MYWIDFSGLKKPAALPKGWHFKRSRRHLPGEAIAQRDEPLLLTMHCADMKEGAIAAVSDHVNLSGINPLRGHNNDDHGVRFPDMSHPYETPPGFKGEKTMIRAGQNEDHIFDAPEAAEIVFQTILAGHQSKKVYALIYGDHVGADELLKSFQGEQYA